MLPARGPSEPRVAVALVVACALVLLRSFVFVVYEHAHFDSDQAVMGLMARDLSRLQAFPVFYYGQQYLLAVEAWLAAPFVLLLGSTVVAVKLPVLILNAILASLLVVRLTRDEGLPASLALLASAFVVLPPPIAASRMVEAGGGQIEPFVYVVLLWMLRRRPVWFGLVLGVGVLNREFTIYAPVALIVIAAWHRRLFAPDVVRRAVVALGAAALVVVLIHLLVPFAANYHPAVARPRVSIGSLQPIAARAASVLTDSLAVIFGARRDVLDDYNIRSGLTVGYWWIAPVLVATAVIVTSRLPFIRRARDRSGSFAVYLALVGVQAATALLVLPEAGGMSIRYALLTLLLPVGAIAFYLSRESERRVAAAVVTLVLLWTAASGWNHARLIAEYLSRPPANIYRELAIYLESNGHRYGWADYWTAYHVTFLTDERVILSPRDVVRISRYERLVAVQPQPVVEIQMRWCPDGTKLREWYICK